MGRKKCAIYEIRNTVNNKVYIGGSTYVIDRLSYHRCKLRDSIHPNKFLQEDYNRYGLDKFQFNIIEYVDNPEDVLVREQYYIDKTNCTDRNKGYNIAKYADSNKGLKHSEETKQIMRKNQTGESNSFFGKTHSEEVKKAVGERNKGSKNHNAKLTEEIVSHIKYLLVNNLATYEEIKQKYKISKSTISRIKLGQSWNYVKPKRMEE